MGTTSPATPGGTSASPRWANWPVLTTTVFVGAVALVVWWGVERERREAMEGWKARLSSLATERVQEVESWISERRADAEVVAAYPPITALLRQIHPGGNDEALADESYERLAGMLSAVERAYGYVYISISDLNGSTVFQTTQNPLPAGDLRATNRGAIDQAALRVQTETDREGHIWVLLSLPVVPESGSRKPLGALNMVASPEKSLWPLLTHESVPTSTGETLLVERKHDDIVFLSPLRHGERPGLEIALPHHTSLAAHYALQGEPHFGELTDYRGVPVLAATRPVPTTDWGIVAKIDRDEAFAQFREMARQTIGLGVLGSIAFAGLMLAASRRQRARLLAVELARERAVAEARERYRLLSDEAHDTVLFLDADGNVIDANRAAEVVYGYSAEELRRLNATDIRVGSTPESIQEMMRNLEAGRRVYEVEHRRRDGSTFPVEVSATGATIGGEKIFLAIIRDITERKRHEAQLERFQSLLAASQEVNQMLARESNRNRLLQQTCATLQRARGYALVWIGVLETEGHRVRPVASAGADTSYLQSATITWDDTPTGQGPTGMAIRTGRPCIAKSIETDPQFAPWREQAISRGYASSAAFPIQHGEKLHGVLCIYTSTPDAFTSEKIDLLQQLAGDIGYALHALDVREQEQRANERLRQSEERFRQAVDHFPYSFIIYDRERRIQFINAQGARQSGYSEQDLLGHTDEEILPPEITAPYLPALHRCAESRQPQRVNCTVSVAGRRSDLIINYIPLLDAGGEIRQILGITHDVTEIRRVEEQVRRLNAELEQRVRERTAELEAANKELEAFAYSVSHDLRAPLRHIEGFIRALEEDHGADLPADARHYMHRINAGSRRMAELIDALLKFSRVGRAELHTREIDLCALARTVFAERRPHDRDVQLIVGDLPVVSGDPALLQQLLDNLIGNAVKFTGSTPKARIEVGTRSFDGEVAFYVADNGVGFSPQYANRLFEVFQRLHTQDEFEGTGIGLSIVKRIVEKHGGRVWAESRPGAGATFFFTLGTKTPP